LKARGITPANRQEIWNVRTSALLDLPDWVFRRAVPGLGCLPHQVWLRPRDAKRLCALDRAAGGRSQVTKSEYKRCGLCARPLIGYEAEQRRKVVESGPMGRTTPCGPDCAQDRETRLWKKLAVAPARSEQ
jgi:hypothetical protein